MSRYWSMPTSIVATRHRHGRMPPVADPRPSWWRQYPRAANAALRQ